MTQHRDMPTHADETSAPSVLDDDGCRSLLERGQIARLGFVADGAPAIVPVNYCLHRGDPVFRVEAGGNLESAVCGQRVALEVDELDPAARSALSVLVRGAAKMFLNGALLARRGQLELNPWAPGRRTSYFRVRDATVTGRLVTPDLPAALWIG